MGRLWFGKQRNGSISVHVDFPSLRRDADDAGIDLAVWARYGESDAANILVFAPGSFTSTEHVQECLRCLLQRFTCSTVTDLRCETYELSLDSTRE